MGRRVNLATIDNKPVAVAAPVEAGAGVPLALLVANPRNPRESLKSLDDLKSIAHRQLQPCLVVTAKGYLALWPEDADQVGDAQYVVVNGCRRLAAAHKYGRSDLLIVHDESVATSRGELLGAAVEENIGRQDFDVIEEAMAVEAVVAEYASAREAAEARGWSPGWISQRRALLKLTPEMQRSLRAGELAVRDARRLARVPAEQQVATWQAELEAAEQRKKARAEERRRAAAEPQSADDAPVDGSPAAFTAVNAAGTELGGAETSSRSAPAFTAVNAEAPVSHVPEPRSATPAPSGVDWSNPQAIADLCTTNMTRDDLEKLLEILTSRL
ncbi:ParB/RepB/Spo0J family partition protein [Streptomyces sp. NPDC048110]|uniref:ParB/RepB/Spo0J family partition protein n=1 Tax=Streptomyces sp. NPDC048110 TaxID=3155483 RepID=UPI0033EF1A7F